MSVQQFCLRWNNHQPNFISVFSTLLHNETLVDVTLAAEGRQLQAHKVVLSACSSYFQTLFTTNPCQHPIVILKDVQYNHLKTMVNFMYYGEVNVSQEQLPDILKTAEMLKIKGLAEMPDAITKSESKSSSSEQIDHSQVGGSESIWCSTESQQFHQQQRRTPSPSSLSPSTRRKRLRKSSTGSGSASTERTSEEQSSIDGGSNMNISAMDPITTYGSNQGNITTNINNTRMLKNSSSTETEAPNQESSQESVETSLHHTGVPVMKSDSDMGNVNQNMPLEIPGSTTPSGNTSSVSGSQSQADKSLLLGCKRTRFLIRQPRIKKDCDTLEHMSPEVEEHPPQYTNLLALPTKIERHSSEPSTSALTTSSHLLTVPQPSYLVKQHSQPLLPSQSQSPPTTTLTLQRQLSHPLTHSTSTIGSTQNTLVKQHSCEAQITQMVTTIKTEDPLLSKATSPTVVIVTDPTSTSMDLPTIRIKTEELQRSVSTPQVTTREISIENARSSHCPVVRPGPALGCNFCWNTIDAHGRILRRKTKYHCPECQTNLCIVPCFQEFHERQANEGIPTTNTTSSTGSNSSNESNKHVISGGLRHYPKTGSL